MMNNRASTKIVTGVKSIGVNSASTEPRGADDVVKIVGLRRRDDTTRRYPFFTASFMGTWSSDDSQYFSVHESIDRAEQPEFTFMTNVYKFIGPPENLSIKAIPAYPVSPWTKGNQQVEFRGGSCLEVDGILYQLVFASNRPYYQTDGTFSPDFTYVGSKIIYSSDQGKSWCNQDGSPARWERWDELSERNMLFYPADPVGPKIWNAKFLQMGKSYSLNQDGFIYLYHNDGGMDGDVNDVILLRVPKERILEREAYEFFAGNEQSGNPFWTSQISKRASVHKFPFGRKSEGGLGKIHDVSPWSLDVTYNPFLSLYMLVAASPLPPPRNGNSYLGMWVADHPWGPFRQIHEEAPWQPGGDRDAAPMVPTIPAKWISDDGRSFWIVWGDAKFMHPNRKTSFGDKEFMEDMRNKNVKDDAQLAQLIRQWADSYFPNTCFNTQQVDVTLS